MTSVAIESAPELLIRSLGVVANFGCSSVLIFWVLPRLIVTFGCLVLKMPLSFSAYSVPRPPSKTTTLTLLSSATPNGLSADFAPEPDLVDVDMPPQPVSAPTTRVSSQQ